MKFVIFKLPEMIPRSKNAIKKLEEVFFVKLSYTIRIKVKFNKNIVAVLSYCIQKL